MRKLTIFIFLSLISWQANFSQPVLTTNIGHSRGIMSVTFSQDGECFASASVDNTVKIWDVSSGKLIKTLTGSIGQSSFLTNVRISHGNKYIMAGDNYNIYLWELNSGKKIKVLKGVYGMDSFEFSLAGEQIIYKTRERGLYYYNISNGHKTVKYPEDKFSILDYNYSKGYILKYGKENSLIIFNEQNGQEIRTFHGHEDYINTAIFSFDYKYIASSSSDKTIRIWDVETGKEISKILYAGVLYIEFSPDGKHLVSGDRDEKIILWDVETGNKVKSFEGHTRRINSIAYSPKGDYFISGSDDATIRMWDVKTGKQIRIMGGSIEPMLSIDFTSDWELFSVRSPRSNSFWNTKNGNIIQKTSSPLSYMNDITFSTDGKMFIKGSYKSRDVNFYNTETGKKLDDFEKTIYNESNVVFSPDGKYIISGRYNDIRIGNIVNNNYIKSLKGHENHVKCIDISPDSKYIVSGSSDKTLKIWDIETGKLLNTLNGHSSRIMSVSYGPNGKYIVSGSEKSGNNIKLWNASNGNEIKTVKGHNAWIRSVTFSPDGKHFASGSYDNTIKIWDVETGQELMTIEAHSSTVNEIKYIFEGKYIVSVSSDGSIKFWKSKTGELLITLYEINNSTDMIAITPDGRFDGTEKGIELLNYVDGLNIIPLSSLYEQYYTPNLFARVLAGEIFDDTEVNIKDIKLPPTVEILSPENNNKFNRKEVSISIKITDSGNGVDEIRLYHNDKLVKTTQRGFKPIENKSDVSTKTFTLSLTKGENKIKATAFNNQRTESIPDEITLFYEGTKSSSDLYLLAIGLDKYKNPKYNLNYAVADALAFKDAIEKGSNTIFESANVSFIADENATRSNLLQEFEKLMNSVKQEDVFILYYAGHGVMSEEKNAQFYIIPYDVTQLYGNNEILKTKAISANELQDFSTKLKAQKQLYIFDACQSGGMTDLLASRGAAEEKAIAQLARSTGTYWLTASNSEQFATEFTELGHGLFTYTILLGLQGKADGVNKDKKVTVQELSSFLNDKVPELSEKHKGEAQYPSIYGYGMDFPIIIIK